MGAVRLLLGGHSFHHQAGETLRGEPSPLQPALQVKDLVPKTAHTTDIHVLLHLLLSMYCDDTAVLLLVYIISRATVVSSVVWARMQGANGGDRNGLCVCWRQEECGSSANSGSLNVGLRQGDKERALCPFRHMQRCAHITGHITTQR